MADPMTPERLAEIRDRELSASEGPWLFKGTEQQDDLSLRLTIGEAPGGEEIARIEVSAEAAGWSFHRMGAQADAEFIAHARSDVPALLAEVERLRAELDARCDKDGCEQYREWLSGEKAEADKRARQAEVERDRLAGQVQGIEQAVHAFFADADQRGVHLDGMTVTELCDAVMAEIRALDGTEAGR